MKNVLDISNQALNWRIQENMEIVKSALDWFRFCGYVITQKYTSSKRQMAKRKLYKKIKLTDLILLMINK